MLLSPMHKNQSQVEVKDETREGESFSFVVWETCAALREERSRLRHTEGQKLPFRSEPPVREQWK